MISARELRKRGLERCPYCGGELLWPLEESAGGGNSEPERDR